MSSAPSCVPPSFVQVSLGLLLPCPMPLRAFQGCAISIGEALHGSLEMGPVVWC